MFNSTSEYYSPIFNTPLLTLPFEQLEDLRTSPYWINSKLNNVSPDVAIETALPGELPFAQPQLTEFFSFGPVDTFLNDGLFDEFITEPFSDSGSDDHSDMFQSVLVPETNQIISPVMELTVGLSPDCTKKSKGCKRIERNNQCFKCPECDLRLKLPSSMKRHLKRHGINSKIDKNVILYESSNKEYI
ncbi:hypothetical protein HK103_003783 [Boothiomyces macroporosus]|uniref:C2H2-type domain-containing protein n=1 Tax=Boothiomyces macroporosus TaxID=261099 RepID=A0AAD5UC92_9FUNG|nr:hypothetical protein HK103_003783 [Boothiomyces macroporosus]